MSNTFTGKVSGRMSSRGWAIALGIGAVVLAAILLVVYLDRYRARVGGRNAPTPVLVAKQLIPAGTPGSIVATNSMYAADDASQEGSRGRSHRGSVVPRRPRRGRRHLPGPADHRRPTSRRAIPLPSTRRSPARSARSRSRSTTSTGRSRRCRSATRSTSTRPSRGVVKLFAAERQGPRRFRPSPARAVARTSSSASRRARRRSGPTRPTTRSSSSSSARSSARSRRSRRPQMQLRC